MEIILRIMFYVSIALIIGVSIDFILDKIEEKVNPSFYLKGHRKYLLKLLLTGIGGLIVSGAFLLFKLY